MHHLRGDSWSPVLAVHCHCDLLCCSHGHLAVCISLLSEFYKLFNFTRTGFIVEINIQLDTKFKKIIQSSIDASRVCNTGLMTWSPDIHHVLSCILSKMLFHYDCCLVLVLMESAHCSSRGVLWLMNSESWNKIVLHPHTQCSSSWKVNHLCLLQITLPLKPTFFFHWGSLF